mgnify:CR=1 FL=1
MAKRGGFPGGGIPGNMNNLGKPDGNHSCERMALAEKEFSAKAGGGAVEVTVTGEKMLKSIQISPDAADPEDVEMLQDMILAAVNEALKQVDDATQAMMGGMTGGLGF